MLEDMDSWRRGPAVHNFLQLHLELRDTFLMNAAVQAKVAFMPKDMDSWRRGTAVCKSRLHSSDASRVVNSRFCSSIVLAPSFDVVAFWVEIGSWNSPSSPSSILRTSKPSALTRIPSPSCSWSQYLSSVVFLTLQGWSGARFMTSLCHLFKQLCFGISLKRCDDMALQLVRGLRLVCGED